MESLVTVAQLHEFDEILDVRTPAEYAEDHVPGAINLPVLSNEERARVGTLYKQVSPFEAKRVGAALIARNIARHLEQSLCDKPRHWRPLVYCWRGGQRSGAMAHILAEIGWKTARLAGGYKAYRRHVLAELERLPRLFRYRVICGPTGSGKSRLLAALARLGAQVLDLEVLAAHRGSVLGELPDRPQPSQKRFESLIWQALAGFDPARPVFVESESRKIGSLCLPEALIATMRAEGQCLFVEADMAVRLALLKAEYAHFLASPARLVEKIACLQSLHSAATLARWRALAEAGRIDELVEDLLLAHYDPAYRRSLAHNFARQETSPRLVLAGPGEADIDRLAAHILAEHGD